MIRKIFLVDNFVIARRYEFYRTSLSTKIEQIMRAIFLQLIRFFLHYENFHWVGVINDNRNCMQNFKQEMITNLFDS